MFLKSSIFLDLGMIIVPQSNLVIFLKLYEIEPSSMTYNTWHRFEPETETETCSFVIENILNLLQFYSDDWICFTLNYFAINISLHTLLWNTEFIRKLIFNLIIVMRTSMKDSDMPCYPPTRWFRSTYPGHKSRPKARARM